MNNFFSLKTSIALIFSIVISGLLGLAFASYYFKKNEFICNPKNKETVIRLIEEVWSKGDLNIVDQLSRSVLPDQKFYNYFS